MAQELARSGGLMIHYSTDYVFDGTKAEPYTEDDATGPLNEYGRSKLAGEQAIAESGCAHIILRTSWVYDTRGTELPAPGAAAGAREARAAHGGRSAWSADLGPGDRRSDSRDCREV